MTRDDADTDDVEHSAVAVRIVEVDGAVVAVPRVPMVPLTDEIVRMTIDDVRR